MGYNLKILSEAQVNTHLFNRCCRLELRENFHNHEADMRPVYTKEEFLALSDMWIEARAKYDAMGQPNPEEQNINLADTRLPGEGLHKDRVALELTGNITTKEREMVHFHINNFRLDLVEEDFMAVARIWTEALRSFNQASAKQISLQDKETVRIPGVAEELYIPWLQEYIDNPEIPRANPDNYWDMFLESKRLLRPEDDQRYSQGWHPTEPRTRTIPEDFNRSYLYTLYEVIKKYGYGKGPFNYDYIPAESLPDGRIHLSAAHRVACLWVLGYNNVEVVVPTKWPR
jgi:hypothetical protein